MIRVPWFAERSGATTPRPIIVVAPSLRDFANHGTIELTCHRALGSLVLLVKYTPALAGGPPLLAARRLIEPLRFHRRLTANHPVT